MKTLSLIAVVSTLSFSSVLLSGCATGNSATGPGFIYSDHYEGIMATSNQSGRKRGEACTENILGLVTTGDASMGAAMKNGAITVVSSIDRHFHSYLWFDVHHCYRKLVN